MLIYSQWVYWYKNQETTEKAKLPFIIKVIRTNLPNLNEDQKSQSTYLQNFYLHSSKILFSMKVAQKYQISTEIKHVREFTLNVSFTILVFFGYTGHLVNKMYFQC